MIGSLILAALCLYFGSIWGELYLQYSGIIFIFLAAISTFVRKRYYDQELG
jgi:hypothetical protein